MANIRVTCPTCGKVLEVGAEHAGEEVECGECFQVFVAEGPPKPKIKAVSTPDPPGMKRKPKRRRDDDDDYEHDQERDEYDDDDYEPPHRRGGGRGSGASGTAVAGLIVGVLALLTSCCPLTGIGLGVLAMVLGAAGKKHPGGAGTGAAATVLGSIALVISVGVIVWLFARG
jgi:hypothetical protein